MLKIVIDVVVDKPGATRVPLFGRSLGGRKVEESSNGHGGRKEEEKFEVDVFSGAMCRGNGSHCRK